MPILFLDDDPARAALFSSRLCEKDKQDTKWVKTASEAISSLKKQGTLYQLIYLDHDLGEPGYEQDSRSEESGMEVVRWFEKQDSVKFKSTIIIIHTWNIPAGTRMFERLRTAGYTVEFIPFGMRR